MAVDFSGQIAAIQAAIAAGVTSVSYEGKSATYRSLAEMTQTVAYLQRTQTRANGGRVQNVARTSFESGYGHHRRGFRG